MTLVVGLADAYPRVIRSVTMKRQLLLGGAAFFAAMALIAGQVVSQEGEGKEKQKGPEEVMMEIWKKMAEPGEYHAHLKPLAGTWNLVVKFRMAPEAPWEEHKGTSESKWILGGRFLLEEVKGEVMEGEERFEGLGIMGYDKVKKKYTSAWVDTMSTAVFTELGMCDKSGKVITTRSEYDDPMTGQKKKGKSVLRIISNDKHVAEMYETGLDGKEFKNLEVVYTRK